MRWLAVYLYIIYIYLIFLSFYHLSLISQYTNPESWMKFRSRRLFCLNTRVDVIIQLQSFIFTKSQFTTQKTNYDRTLDILSPSWPQDTPRYDGLQHPLLLNWSYQRSQNNWWSTNWLNDHSAFLTDGLSESSAGSQMDV